MNEMEMETGPGRMPRTLVVLVLLAMTSLTFSYLAAYAIADAMVAAEILPPWPPGADPRPQWMMMSFVVLLSAFVLIAGVARCLSTRQLRQIDAMAEGEEMENGKW